MQTWHATLLMAGVILAAGGYALVHDVPQPERPRIEPASTQESSEEEEEEEEEEEPGHDEAVEDPAAAGDFAADPEPPAIQWSVPAGWHAVPNPSSVRLASYAVPHEPGDPEDADVSVTRAGGDVAANVDRWAAQFEGAAAPVRTSRKVHGLDVTLVEIEGAYASAMRAEGKARPGWMLLGAIVGAPGQPYFFKMTGPAATVRAARRSFAALVDSVRPAADVSARPAPSARPSR